jgi:hypothetical protein
MKIEIESSPTLEDRQVVERGLHQHNDQYVSADGDSSFAVFLRDPNGAVIGGVSKRSQTNTRAFLCASHYSNQEGLMKFKPILRFALIVFLLLTAADVTAQVNGNKAAIAVMQLAEARQIELDAPRPLVLRGAGAD